jgi:phosphopantothenoylcysteine synthetase/decarboxylase
MRCLVTAGATHELVDLVRRLTNFSTGRLGTELAVRLADCGHEVLLLRSTAASAPPPPPHVRTVWFTSVMDLAARFLEYADESRLAIFHAAAVSDFVPGLMLERDPGGGTRAIYSSKFPSRSGTLLLELRPAPKLLSGLREWYPNAWITGWKYEVEGDYEQAVARGRRQLEEARSDLCVVNGPAHGEGFSLVRRDGGVEVAGTTEMLFERLGARLV